jgi:tol-pal system protein YbgF
MKRTALLLLLVCSFSAKAGLFDDEEARRQIRDVAAQVEILRKEALELQKTTGERIGLTEANQTRRLTEMFNQLEKLRQEIATLRGQQEVIQFNVDEASKRQKDLYLDLDTRLRALEQAKFESKAAAQAGEQARFDEAVQLVKSGSSKDAINALNKFAKDYPQSKHLAAAAYWLGQAQLANKDLKAANTSFSYVVSQAPNDATAPDALLGLATIAAQQNDRKTSRKYLVNIIEKYPQSAAAETAKKALTVPE